MFPRENITDQMNLGSSADLRGYHNSTSTASFVQASILIYSICHRDKESFHPALASIFTGAIKPQHGLPFSSSLHRSRHYHCYYFRFVDFIYEAARKHQNGTAMH